MDDFKDACGNLVTGISPPPLNAQLGMIHLGQREPESRRSKEKRPRLHNTDADDF